MDNRRLGPRIVCPRVPEGLTELKLAEAHSRMAERELRGEGCTLGERYTLIPELLPENALHPPKASGPPSPQNVLLDLYHRGRDPIEGMASVANYLGDFCGLVAKDMNIEGLVVVASGDGHAEAHQCGSHWHLKAPMYSGTRFDLPSTGCWQVPETAPVDNPSPGSSVVEPRPPIPRWSDQDSDATLRSWTNGSALVANLESDLCIHTDDAPVTWEANRFFKDFELKQAVQDIKDCRENVEFARTRIQAINWAERKRTCHLHLMGSLFERLGNSTFQEIPERLYRHRIRISGWPAKCDLPLTSNVGKYNSEKVREMLLAIWFGTLCVKDWGRDEQAETFPALIIDTDGVSTTFQAHLSSMLEGGVASSATAQSDEDMPQLQNSPSLGVSLDPMAHTATSHYTLDEAPVVPELAKGFEVSPLPPLQLRPAGKSGSAPRAQRKGTAPAEEPLPGITTRARAKRKRASSPDEPQDHPAPGSPMALAAVALPNKRRRR